MRFYRMRRFFVYGHTRPDSLTESMKLEVEPFGFPKSLLSICLCSCSWHAIGLYAEVIHILFCMDYWLNFSPASYGISWFPYGKLDHAFLLAKGGILSSHGTLTEHWPHEKAIIPYVLILNGLFRDSAGRPRFIIFSRKISKIAFQEFLSEGKIISTVGTLNDRAAGRCRSAYEKLLGGLHAT